MNSDILVSVIVPVYNSQEYLRQCMDSVLQQSLKEIEVICVDDGSEDQSLLILEEYAKADERVRILHQKQQYAGIARNNGLKYARGKYLVFWDSDDYFYPTALEKMFDQCEKDQADLCICGANQYYCDTELEVRTSIYLDMNHVPNEVPFNQTMIPDSILNITTVVPWNKMYLREFVLQTGIEFQGVRNGNDIYFVTCMICLAERITIVDDILVCYRKNQGTNLVSNMAKSPVSPIQAWTCAAETLRERERFPQRSFANKALASMIYLLDNLPTWESYTTAYELLQTEGLKNMGILIQEEGYYFNQLFHENVKHLWMDSAEEFLTYRYHFQYKARERAIAEKKDLALKVKRLRNRERRFRGEYEKGRLEMENVIKDLEKKEIMHVETIEDQNNKIRTLEEEMQKLRKENEDLKQTFFQRIKKYWC